MNDIELTKKRQEEIAKYGKRQGFPIWVCFKLNYLEDIVEIKTFFTVQGKDNYISQKIAGYNFVAYLTYSNDIKNVSYSI
jgi:hypothetical protein|nr:MAG TPA: hypothetical protein [Caudoviricetes sp.]